MIPIDEAVAEFTKDQLKEKYSSFGVWLYATELAALFGMLIAAPRAWTPWLFIILAFVTWKFRRYLRKFGDKSPSRETVVTECMVAGLAGVILGIFLLMVFAGTSTEDNGVDPAFSSAAVSVDGSVDDPNNEMMVMNATFDPPATQAGEEANAADDDYCSVDEFEKNGCEGG
jgi:hypothetical protein